MSYLRYFQCPMLTRIYSSYLQPKGLPPPWVYDLCNCFTSKKPPFVPACTIQVYVRGIAFGLTNNALVYEAPDSLAFFDGYVKNENFQPSGDIW